MKDFRKIFSTAVAFVMATALFADVTFAAESNKAESKKESRLAAAPTPIVRRCCPSVGFNGRVRLQGFGDY